MKPLLEVSRLSVAHKGRYENTPILNDVSFHIDEGEVFTLVGESGSGKSTLANSITRLFPPGAGLFMEGSIRFEGREVKDLLEDELRLVRKRNIRYVFQEPLQSLNPLARVHSQLKFATASSQGEPAGSGRIYAEWLARVGIENQSEVLQAYPHQLSGGMAQRVLLAMALAPSPKLLVADEPTSSLDTPLRFQILDLLMALRESEAMALLLITHDLDIARRYADRIAVLYAGRIVELAPRGKFFDNPLHPYSQLLLRAAHERTRSMAIVRARNESEDFLPATEGCRFVRRCYKAREDCGLEEPPLEMIDEDRQVRCPYWKL